MIKRLRLIINIALFTTVLSLITFMYVFAARGVGVISDYTISFISPYCFLVDGDEVNIAIKKVVNNSVNSYSTNDNTIKHIVFDNWDDSRYGSMFNWDTSSSSNIDATLNANIRVFYKNNTKTAYILSPNLIASRDCAYMFQNFTALESVDFQNFNSVESVSNESMFYGCSSLTNIINGSNISTNLSTSTKNMFYNCGSLTSVDTSDYRTPNVLNMSGMFKNSGITSIDISGFDASKVTDFSEMFSGCASLTSFDAQTIKMEAANTMANMFLGCSSLVSLDLTGFSTGNVTSMEGMFSGCTSLANIDIPASTFLTVNVITFEKMFYNCTSLRTLDLKNMTTDKTTNFSYMFAQSSVEELNLSKFDTSNATNMTQMFYTMPNLTTVSVSNLWTTINVTSATNMFANTSNIVGGWGTIYDSGKVNGEYAHVDLPDTKGYLTACDVSYKGVYVYDEYSNLLEITYVGTESPYTLPVATEYDYFKDSSNNTYQPGQTLGYEIFNGVENVEFTMYVKRYTVSMANGDYGSYVRRTVSYVYKGQTTTIYNNVTSTSSSGTIPAGAEVTISVSTSSSSYTNPRVTISPSSVTLTTVSQYSSYKFTMPNQAVTLTFTASYSGGFCIASGTMVTLSDGTLKSIDDVTLEDRLLVFDHENGELTTVDVNFIEYDGVNEYNVINLEFSDGITTRIIYEHGFFDLDENKYVYIHEEDCLNYLGHRFLKLVGDQHEIVTLTNAFITTENIGCYSIVGKYHLDFYADNLLSMPGGISGLFNIFNYDENLKFVNMEEELSEYGVFTYDDFAEFMSEETFNLYPIPHLKVALAKGIITEEFMLYLIERYT